MKPTHLVAGAPPPVAATPTPAAAATAPDAEAVSLGQLEFTVSGSPVCKHKFRVGMLALHSFLYDQAHETFEAALAADPLCAMAAWGDAMAYDHPVWHERDLVKGRSALAKVSNEETLTAKERAYFAAARTVFMKVNMKDAHVAWLAATAAMHRDYPEDDEVLLQHALALITVYGSDSSHVREQMEAGAIALSVLQRRPMHPGAAHYAIHAFDTREHAILALPAARAYATIAPDGFHALHMPSHTFTHLGMWRDVVLSNEKAYAASVAWETAHGHRPGKYDWHSYSWLVAAHLELGQVATARKLMEDAHAMLIEAKDDTWRFRRSYMDLVADYLSQTERWGETEALVAPVFAPVPDEGPEETGPVACGMHAPGGTGDARPPAVLSARLTANVLAAIRLRDEATAVKRVADMKRVRAQMAPWSKTFRPSFAVEWDAFEDSLLTRAHAAAQPSAATQKKALDALEKVKRLETSDTVAGPAWDRTTRETLGETLLASGKAKEALVQFEEDLDARPNRAIALLDAARAAKAFGETDKARGYYAALVELWSDADADLPALSEARAGRHP